MCMQCMTVFISRAVISFPLTLHRCCLDVWQTLISSSEYYPLHLCPGVLTTLQFQTPVLTDTKLYQAFSVHHYMSELCNRINKSYIVTLIIWPRDPTHNKTSGTFIYLFYCFIFWACFFFWHFPIPMFPMSPVAIISYSKQLTIENGIFVEITIFNSLSKKH